MSAVWFASEAPGGAIWALSDIPAGANASVGAVGYVFGVVSAQANAQAGGVVADVDAVGYIFGTVGVSVEVPDPLPTPEPAGGYTATAPLTRWPDKDPREGFTISFTFPGPPTDVVINIDVYSPYGRTDDDPESLFVGSFEVRENSVIQRIARDSGVDLVDYYIDCVATVNGQRLVAAGCLPVRVR
jgi:hypothetical protein